MDTEALIRNLLGFCAILLLCLIVIQCCRDAKAARLEALKRKLAKLQGRYDAAANAYESSTGPVMYDILCIKSELADRVKQVQHEIQRLEKP